MISFQQLREAILAVQERPTTLIGGAWTPAKRKELLEAPHIAGLIEEIHEEAERARREPVPLLSVRPAWALSLGFKSRMVKAVVAIA